MVTASASQQADGGTTGPALAESVVPRLGYKPGWRFKVGGPGGRSLCVYVDAPDSLNPTRRRITQHVQPIPDDLTDEQAFLRWVLATLHKIERHETAEFLQLDGTRPFFPHHNGGDPYQHVEHWKDPPPWH